jgi:predicted nucleic acid-binding protein
MRIYLDACCVNRLTDDQSQPRVREEADALERIMRSVRLRNSVWIGSEVLNEEIENSPHRERTRENRALLELASENVETNESILDRARSLQSVGYSGYDALHLASAEAAQADILLSTDDKFVKRALRGDGAPRVAVRNPILWLQEVPE